MTAFPRFPKIIAPVTLAFIVLNLALAILFNSLLFMLYLHFPGRLRRTGILFVPRRAFKSRVLIRLLRLIKGKREAVFATGVAVAIINVDAHLYLVGGVQALA